MKKFWNMIKNAETSENEIRIDGDIGFDLWGWLFGDECVTGKSFREDLAQFRGQAVTVWINSNGGNAFDASQIYTALKEHNGRVTVKIDGTAISAASVIAMAGHKVLMSPTSLMMIHNPWTVVEGEVKDMEHTIEVLSTVKESLVNAYQIKTGLSRAEVSRLMDEETWFSPKKAVEMGFADGMLHQKEMPEEVISGIVDGAKLVFNSLSRPNIADIIKQHRDKASDTDVFFMQKELLELEKIRYGGI